MSKVMVLTYYEPGKEPRVEINWSTFPAGRELDALVIQRVLGRSTEPHWPDDGDGYDLCPSQNIDQAWEVVEHIQNSGDHNDFLSFYLTPSLAGNEAPYRREWLCSFDGGLGPLTVSADTVPLAICRAALAWAARKP